MIMDTKKLLWTALLLAIVFLSCDPPSSEKLFIINNNTSKTLSISVDNSSGIKKMDIQPHNQINILEFGGIGGDFGAVSDFNSISFTLNNGKYFKHIRPENSYGYIDIDNGIGTDRNIPKDFYNKKYWKFKTVGDDEEWIFTINEEDLALFE